MVLSLAFEVVSQSIKTELFNNQVWHGLNFSAKALLLVVLTPFMLLKWGEALFGVYALASSLVVCLAVMDGGIRDATRLALCEADRRVDSAGFRLALQSGVTSFLILVGVFFLLSIPLAWVGVFSSVLHLPREGDGVICCTILLTGLTMTLVLMLEPLAARNQLSLIKKASTIGSVTAIPLVAAGVAMGGGPMVVILIYFVCQSTPFIWLWVRSGLIYENPFVWLRWSDYWKTYRASGWMYFNNIVWLIRTHALPFVVSAVTGPAEAGVFYILIRISEVISTLGAASSETLLASLKSAETADERFNIFSHTYSYCLVFCSYSALVLVFLGRPLLSLLFHHQLEVTNLELAAVAVFGLAGALAAILLGCGYGLNLLPDLGFANLIVGLLTCLGCYLTQAKWGSAATLSLGALAHLALGPCAKKITGRLDATVAELWLWPLRPMIYPWLIAMILLWDAQVLERPWIQGGALVVVAILVFRDWKRVQIKPVA